jgi:23S rRNA (guanosine2251-2'-O)-methyltransferase
MVAGRNPVEDLIRSGDTIEKIMIQTNLGGSYAKVIEDLVREKGIPVQYVPRIKLDHMCDIAHQGVIALRSLIPYQNYEDIVNFVYSEGRNPLFLFLDRVTDVRNFGAIARTAYGMGVDAILIPLKDAASINTDAIKTSAGALMNIPICRLGRPDNELENLKQMGFHINAIDISGDKFITEMDKEVPMVIVMGAEDKGVRNEIIRIANGIFKIPIHSDLDSYNVSVATALVLYEVKR